MQGHGRPDIVNSGSREIRYSECRVLDLVTDYKVLTMLLSKRCSV
ncbi:unnamed protein product, partial [Staurois parvus]